MVDALIGGAVALVVAAALPAAVLGELAGALRGVARAIERRDPDNAAAVLDRARDAHQTVDEFRTALQVAEEIATIAPIRRHRRPELDRYLTLVSPADYALGDTPGVDPACRRRSASRGSDTARAACGTRSAK
jgi:hypothetical protein